MAQLSERYLALKAKRDAKRKTPLRSAAQIRASEAERRAAAKAKRDAKRLGAVTPVETPREKEARKRAELVAAGKIKVRYRTPTAQEAVEAATPTEGTETAPETTTEGEAPTTEAATTEEAVTEEPTEEGAAALTEAEAALETGVEEQKDIAQQDYETASTLAQQEYDNAQADLSEQQAYLEELTAKREALIASGTEVQKAELEADYASNKAATEAAQAKTATAYAKAQEQQKLFNEQRKIREETALGLIGGFGSSAGLANIEQVIMQGEEKFIDLQTQAAEADVDYANQLQDLSSSFSVDKQKIDQYKNEQLDSIYSELEQYTMEIMSNKRLASLQKSKMIAEAVSQYNSRVGELSMQVLSARNTLAQALVSRSDMLRQEEFSRSLTLAQEERAKEAFGMEKEQYEAAKVEKAQAAAMTKLTNILNMNVGKLYAHFTGASRKEIDALAKEAGYDSKFVIRYLKLQKDAQEASTAQAQMALEEKILKLQLDVPKGQQFTIGGQTYTGMKKVTGGGGGGKAITMDKLLSLDYIKYAEEKYPDIASMIVPGVTTFGDLSNLISESQQITTQDIYAGIDDAFNQNISYEAAYNNILSYNLPQDQQDAAIAYLNTLYNTDDEEGFLSSSGGWLSNTFDSLFAENPYEEEERDLSEIETTLSMPNY